MGHSTQEGIYVLVDDPITPGQSISAAKLPPAAAFPTKPT